jgi:hypothetical protein
MIKNYINVRLDLATFFARPWAHGLGTELALVEPGKVILSPLAINQV